MSKLAWDDRETESYAAIRGLLSLSVEQGEGGWYAMVAGRDEPVCPTREAAKAAAERAAWYVLAG